MKTFKSILIPVMAAAFAICSFSSAKAQVVLLGGLDQSYTTANASTSVNLDALSAGWAGIANGAAGPYQPAYFGGRINFSQGDQGYLTAAAVLSFLTNNSPVYADNVTLNTNAVGNYSDLTGKSWNFQNGNNAIAPVNSYGNTGVPIDGTFDFVVGYTQTGPYNASISLWLGANADAATQGAPDITNLFGSGAISPVNTIGLAYTANVNGQSFLTTSNMFSADVWTPVSAVPEPSACSMLMLLGGLGALALLRRRMNA